MTGKKLPPRVGVARKQMDTRVAPAAQAMIVKRAADEADGNRGEMVRRLLAWSLTGPVKMPKGWKP